MKLEPCTQLVKVLTFFFNQLHLPDFQTAAFYSQLIETRPFHINLNRHNRLAELASRAFFYQQTTRVFT